MRNYQRTYKNLTDTIIDLWAKYGFNGISIRMITKNIKIKESTFYYYFKSKKNIYDKIFKMLEEIFYNLKISKNNNGYLFIQNSIINILKIFKEPKNYKLWRIMNIESFNGDITIKNQIYNLKKYIKNYFFQILLYLRNDNLIKYYDIDMIVDDFYNNIISMINEYTELKFEDKDTTAIEERIFNYIKYFWDKIKK